MPAEAPGSRVFLPSAETRGSRCSRSSRELAPDTHTHTHTLVRDDGEILKIRILSNYRVMRCFPLAVVSRLPPLDDSHTLALLFLARLSPPFFSLKVYRDDIFSITYSLRLLGWTFFSYWIMNLLARRPARE